MKVLNFGSLNMDHVYSVDHIVRPGETISSAGLEFFPGGKGLNQSIAIAKAGVKVYHAGMVGEEGGEALLDVCRKNGVDVSLIRMVPGQSGHTVIQVDRNGQNSIILFGGANQQITKDYVDGVLGHFGKGDLLLLQNEINLLDYMIDRAYEAGMYIILNPSPFDDKITKCRLDKISMFVLNEVEGEQITGEQNPERMPSALLSAYPEASIVLTLGERGSVFCSRTSSFRQDAFHVHAVDTTAAGDTFTGYLISGLVNHWPVPKILETASRASAIAVTRRGAASSIPAREEVSAWTAG